MTWIVEVFSSESSFARLLTVVFSAVVAVLVVLLNQWFVSKRSRRDLLIEKIEELFFISNDYYLACREIVSSIHNQHIDGDIDYYSYDVDMADDIRQCVAKIEMLCGLYFKDEGLDEKLGPNDIPVSHLAFARTKINNEEFNVILDDSFKHIRIKKTNLDKFSKKLMEKYGH